MAAERNEKLKSKVDKTATLERCYLMLLDVRLNVIDFARNEIIVRDGKGAKDRITMLPDSLKEPLQKHLKKVKAIHERDLADGWGRVLLPAALDRYRNHIYPPVLSAEHGLIFCKCRCYERIAGGVLYRDVATQRCYGESI